MRLFSNCGRKKKKKTNTKENTVTDRQYNSITNTAVFFAGKDYTGHAYIIIFIFTTQS